MQSYSESQFAILLESAIIESLFGLAEEGEKDSMTSLELNLIASQIDDADSTDVTKPDDEEEEEEIHMDADINTGLATGSTVSSSAILVP